MLERVILRKPHAQRGPLLPLDDDTIKFDLTFHFSEDAWAAFGTAFAAWPI